MAQILMCDMCGNVSTEMAAKVVIYPANITFPMHRAEYIDDSAVAKDVCSPCLDKMIQPRTLKVLTAEDKDAL